MPFPTLRTKPISARPAGSPNNWPNKPKDEAFQLPKLPPMPPLTDPDKPRIDIRPADLLSAPPPPKMDDKRLYEFVVNKCWKESREARWHWEMNWRLCLEFYQGNQWYGVDYKTRQIINFCQSDPDPARFCTIPLIRPRIESVISMVTQAAPDSQAVPLTTAPIDVQAAVEGRGILAHYNRKYDPIAQLREACDWCATYTTAFLKSTYEPGVLAETPEYTTAPDGSQTISGVTSAPIGDIEERIIPGARIYGDPTGLKISDWRWLIHAELYPLSWYQDNFENGYAVKADPGGGVVSYDNWNTSIGVCAGYGLGMMTGATLGHHPNVNRDVATCYEMWILPGKVATFPHGALIVCAGDQVLVPKKKSKDAKGHPLAPAWANTFGATVDADEETQKQVSKRIPGNYRPWPYECVTEFPFIDLSFAPNPDSAYGRNLVQDLIEPQQDYNRARTRIRERLEREKPVLLINKLAGKGADKLVDLGMYCEVPVNNTGGSTSQWITQPEVSAQQFSILEIIEKNMDDICGIHDPNFRGEVNPGVVSGKAIAGLKQGDSSRLARFGAAVEHFVERRDTWRLRHASQFFATERLMGMDDTGNPAKTPGAMDHAAIHMPFHVMSAAMGQQPGLQSPPQIQQPAHAGIPSISPSSALGPMQASPPPGLQSPTSPTPNTPPGLPSGQQPDPTAEVAGNPYANVLSFKALTGGGQCRIVVAPGSALSDTPDAQNQKYMQAYQDGLMGPVGSPGAAKICVQLMKEAGSELWLQRLTELQDRMDMEAALNAPPPQPPPPDPMETARLESSLAIAEYNAKSEADTRSKIAVMQAEAALPIKPSLSIAGKLSPAGEIAAEEELDLDVHGSATHIATVEKIAPDVHHGYGVGPPPSAQKEMLEHQAAVGAASNIVGAQHQAGIADEGAARDHGMAKDAAEHGAGLTAQQSELQQDQMRTQAELTPKPTTDKSG